MSSVQAWWLHTCIHTCIYTDIHKHMNIRICMWTYMHTFISSVQASCNHSWLQHTHIYTCMYTCIRKHTNKQVYIWTYMHTFMGWLRLVGSLKLHVFFAKEPYKRDYILQKRPIIWRSLLIVDIPYLHFECALSLSLRVCRPLALTHDHHLPIYIYTHIYTYLHIHRYIHTHVHV